MSSAVPDVDPADFTEEAIAKLAPDCNECGPNPGVRLVKGAAVYARRPDLHELWFWRCSCGAYCGTHKGTLKAKGTPAGFATREARKAAHAAFDPLWKRKAEKDGIPVGKARGLGYKWLAAQMGMAPADCHIAMMGEHDARRVVSVIRNRSRK